MKEKVLISVPEVELKKHLEDKPIIKLKVDKRTVCLSYHSENWVAFEEGCPHLGVSLAGGNLTPFGEVACSWHGYRFNLFDGQEAEQRCRNLELYEVTVNNGFLTLKI